MPTPLKLLILEDSAFDAELEVGKLQAAGYECDWQQVQTREEFEASLDRPEFELILADYNLPNFDGLSALGLLRERGLEIPFVLISGTLGEERAIESLKAGATDYVMKERLERLAPVVTRALNDRLERPIAAPRNRRCGTPTAGCRHFRCDSSRWKKPSGAASRANCTTASGSCSLRLNCASRASIRPQQTTILAGANALRRLTTRSSKCVACRAT